MTTNDIDAIRKLTDATDRAPWTAHPDGLVWSELIGDPVSGSVLIENAEFIAAARTLVPALCDEVEQLRAAHDSAVAAIAEAESDIDDRDSEISTLKQDLDLQTKAAWDNRSAIERLTAERDAARKDRDEYAEDNTRVAVALIDVQRKLAGLEADHASAVQANTAYANENARLRSQLAEQQPVVEAAKAWRAQFAKPAATKAPRMAALIAAVDALPTEPKAEADGDDKPCCGYGCNDNLTGVTR